MLFSWCWYCTVFRRISFLENTHWNMKERGHHICDFLSNGSEMLTTWRVLRELFKLFLQLFCNLQWFQNKRFKKKIITLQSHLIFSECLSWVFFKNQLLALQKIWFALQFCKYRWECDSAQPLIHSLSNYFLRASCL